MHKHLLVSCDGLLFELSTGSGVAHELRQELLGVALLQELFSQREEARKFADIVARYSLHALQLGLVHVGARLLPEDVNENVDAFKVLGVVEVDEASLPELLLVDG